MEVAELEAMVVALQVRSEALQVRSEALQVRSKQQDCALIELQHDNDEFRRKLAMYSMLERGELPPNDDLTKIIMKEV